MHRGTLCLAPLVTLYPIFYMNLKRIFEDFEKFSRFLELNEQNVSGDCSADHSQVDHPFRFESSFNHPEITEPLTAYPKPYVQNRPEKPGMTEKLCRI